MNWPFETSNSECPDSSPVELPSHLKDSFCAAPWVHAHVNTEGKRALCCIARRPKDETHSFEKLEDFWNSSYMKQIRVQMLSGNLPDDCDHCRKSPRPMTYRTEFNRGSRRFIPEILASTSADGTTTSKAKFFDYRTQICNLACKTCSPSASTRYHQNLRSSPVGANVVDIKHLADPKVVAKNYHEHVAPELLKQMKGSDVSVVYFAGGEPLSDPWHRKFLQASIESGRSSETVLYYNTNLTLSPKMLESYLMLWRDFSAVTIYISIDGARETGEWIRNGLDFEKLRRNIEFLQENKPERMFLCLDPTLTSLLMLNLWEFTEFVLQLNMPVVSKLMMDNEDIAGFLRVEFLPRSIRKRIVDDWFSRIASVDWSALTLINIFASTLRMAVECDEYLPGSKDFVRQMDAFHALYPSQKHFREFLLGNQYTENWARSAFFMEK